MEYFSIKKWVYVPFMESGQTHVWFTWKVILGTCKARLEKAIQLLHSSWFLGRCAFGVLKSGYPEVIMLERPWEGSHRNRKRCLMGPSFKPPSSLSLPSPVIRPMHEEAFEMTPAIATIWLQSYERLWATTSKPSYFQIPEPQKTRGRIKHYCFGVIYM